MIGRILRLLRPAPAPAPAGTDPRALGDAARDRRDWAEAARHYAAWLDAHPDDAGIQVQLGHARKEAGDLAGAEAAYRAAMALRPEDPDAPLQLGHALKLQGRVEEAREAYRLSDELMPVNHAAIELEALGERPATRPRAPRRAAAAPEDRAAHRRAREAAFRANPQRLEWLRLREAGGDPGDPPGAPGGPVLLDVTDLLAMLRAVGRATGIQRVQLGICAHLLDAAPGRFRVVAMEAPLGPCWTLRADDVRALIRHATQEAHDPGRARALVEAALDRGEWTGWDGAEAFVVLGAFWYFAGATAFLDGLRARGIRVGIMAYDLIPLSHPEHADAGTVLAFRQALDEGARRWDFAFSISEHTAAAMRAALAERGAPHVPVRAVPLGSRFTDAARGGLPAAARDLAGRPFALTVGTIESRKNHLALFQAWKALLEEGVEPPPLLCVGRPGWRVEDVLAQLRATDFLGGRIRLLHGVSDAELAALYANAAFTLFPSFTEGWGLPVGESLAFGTPVLAAMTGATPEAAMGFAEPIDPFSPRQIAAAVRRWTEDGAALDAARARVRGGFRPRGWDAVGQDFTAALDALLETAPAPRAPTAEPLALGGEWRGPALAAALGPGFAPPEGEVAWIAGRTATLRVDAAPGRLVLSLAARPWAAGNAVEATGAAPRPLADGASLALDWPGGQGSVTLHVTGPLDAPPGEDSRPIRTGLLSLRLLDAAPPLLAAGQAWRAGDPALDAALRPDGAGLRLRVAAPEGTPLRLLLLHGDGEALRLSLAAGPDGRVELPLPAPPLLLAWAREDDLPARLALLEAAPPPAPDLALRIAALEAGPAAPPPPPGEAGRAAWRLLGR